MQTRERSVAKWGNAPAIRIPKLVMEKAQISEGDRVDFEVQGPGIVIVRATKSKPSLGDLVSRITSENCHNETEWGDRKGREIW